MMSELVLCNMFFFLPLAYTVCVGFLNHDCIQLITGSLMINIYISKDMKSQPIMLIHKCNSVTVITQHDLLI